MIFLFSSASAAFSSLAKTRGKFSACVRSSPPLLLLSNFSSSTVKCDKWFCFCFSRSRLLWEMTCNVFEISASAVGCAGGEKSFWNNFFGSFLPNCGAQILCSYWKAIFQSKPRKSFYRRIVRAPPLAANLRVFFIWGWLDFNAIFWLFEFQI